ncbi:MAG: hypothetical protein IKY28_04810 [Anaerotignum sp.]|nr:hypothetical protein [Anaerotignum sp.]
MKFSERKEILEEIELQKEIKQSYIRKYIRKFVLFGFAIIIGIASQARKEDLTTPSQDDIALSTALTTIEGREDAISEKYSGAEITRERTYGKDIITVFEVGDQYSFCVFEAMEDGYWLEYCGKLFPKTELVKGTVYLGDNTHEYDIYLQYENIYSRLLVTQTNKKYTKHKEKQNISFDENGIGITKIDYHRTRYFKTQIEAYDTEGNKYILDDGGLF